MLTASGDAVCIHSCCAITSSLLQPVFLSAFVSHSICGCCCAQRPSQSAIAAQAANVRASRPLLLRQPWWWLPIPAPYDPWVLWSVSYKCILSSCLIKVLSMESCYEVVIRPWNPSRCLIEEHVVIYCSAATLFSVHVRQHVPHHGLPPHHRLLPHVHRKQGCTDPVFCAREVVSSCEGSQPSDKWQHTLQLSVYSDFKVSSVESGTLMCELMRRLCSCMHTHPNLHLFQ